MANVVTSSSAINPNFYSSTSATQNSLLSGNSNITSNAIPQPRRRKISVIRVHPLGLPTNISNSSMPSSVIFEQQQGCSTAPVQTTAQPPTFPTVTSANSAGTIPEAALSMEKGVSGESTSSTGNPLSPSSTTASLTKSKRLVSQSMADLPSKLSEIFRTRTNSNTSSRTKTLTSMKNLAKSCADLRQIDDANATNEEEGPSAQNSPNAVDASVPGAYSSPMESPALMSPSPTSSRFHFPATKGEKSALDMDIMERRIRHAMALEQAARSGGSTNSRTSYTIHPQLPTYRASVLGSPPTARSKFAEKNLAGRIRADSSISDSDDEGFPSAYPYHKKYTSKSAMSSPQRLSPTKMTRVTAATPGLVDDPSKLLKAKLKHTHSLSVNNLPDSLMKESKSYKRGQTYHHLLQGAQPEGKEGPVPIIKPSAKRPKDLTIPSHPSSIPSNPVSVPLPKDNVYYTIHGGMNPLTPVERSNLRRFEDCERMDCAGEVEFLDESYEDMMMEESGNSFEEGFYYPTSIPHHQQQYHNSSNYYYPFSSGGSSYNNTRRSGSPSSGYKTMGPFQFPGNYSATISSSSYSCDPLLTKYLKERERQRQQQQHLNKYYTCAVRL